MHCMSQVNGAGSQLTLVLYTWMQGRAKLLKPLPVALLLGVHLHGWSRGAGGVPGGAGCAGVVGEGWARRSASLMVPMIPTL